MGMEKQNNLKKQQYEKLAMGLNAIAANYEEAKDAMLRFDEISNYVMKKPPWLYEKPDYIETRNETVETNDRELK